MNTITNKQLKQLKNELEYIFNSKSVYQTIGLREGVNKFYITHSFTRQQFCVKQDKNNQWYIHGYKNDTFPEGHPLLNVITILNEGDK